MAEEGRAIATAPCLICGQVFAFDPDLVCSFPWPPPEGVREPICYRCITTRVNPIRKLRGHDPFPILPGAYFQEAEDA